MTVQVLYFFLCAFVTVGGYTACFYFAKRDWLGYAVWAFIIASSGAGAATKIVYNNPNGRIQQEETKP